MMENILLGALIYIILGAILWTVIETDNKIERSISGRNRQAPFKFLKTTVFWGPRLVSNWPSSEWLCK